MAAPKTGVRQLFLFHHDPDHDDNTIRRMVDDARKLAGRSSVKIDAAREGQTWKSPAAPHDL